MELKNYQKSAISDLKSYLDYLGRTDDIKTAYNEFWEAKEINVGLGGVPVYNSTIKGVPQLCFKVPTGGGKTLMACASIKAIFSKLDYRKEKVVVWLVPSDAILEQTVRNLKNTDHPYRQKIDSDFGGRVEIYTKQELLNGQNFNPSVVRENLCIMVLSFDSLRITKKEGRKVYQQNGNLDSFSRVYADYPNLIEDADATALIQIINKLRPVVIVDESHNATSELSVEMLNNLNPSITLDLTATPRKNSNIITYVDAMQLKRNNMVKLPVIVYNNKSTQEVMERTIELRANLEVAAIEDEKVTGNYIRPIVLFQAQPKTNENAENYEKMREKLIKANIPKEQIAIKVSGLDELKGIDLLSRDCPIRYISDKDSNVNFESVAIDVKKVDLERTDRGVQPVASKMTAHEQELFRRQIELSCKTLQSLMDTAINTMYNLLNRMDEIHSTELKAYIKRVLADKDGDMLKLIVTNPNSSAAKIKEKIKSLENDYITQQFYELIETEEISLQDSWQFPKDVFFKTTVGHIPKALYEEEDGGMNNLEYNIITAVADCDNVVWWHRNPENSGFCINGNINHYPDFIVKLESGKIVLIETKGNQLENTDSKIKVQLGKKWQALAGNKFKYYMVFMTDADLIPEAVRFDNFITTLKKL